MALVLGDQLHVINTPVGIRDEALQQHLEVGRQAVDGWGVEQVAVVLEGAGCSAVAHHQRQVTAGG